MISGGSGTRLWPVSRETYPKQFAEFFDHSFLRQTLERVAKLGAPTVVTLDSMRALTEKTLGDVRLSRSALTLEPYGKNTAPAVALKAHLLEMAHVAGDEVLGVFPADHLISDEEGFLRAARMAEALARDGQVVTFGVQTRYAATGYGYLEVAAAPRGESPVKVKKFHEKPDAERAETYLRSPLHFWNAGIFFFRLDRISELFATHMPDMWRRIRSIKSDLSNLKTVYANLSSQSLDYGIMEKLTDQLSCVPVNIGWSDVGSWDELARLQQEKITVDSKGAVHTYQSGGNFVYSSHSKVVGLCGVNDLIVVDTPDALLVSRRGQSQNVKELVAGMREAKLPVVTEHRFEIRPWGGFEILSDNQNHKVKRLTLDVGAQMSYQVHARRDEHWVVVSGEAEILMDDQSTLLREGEQLYVRRNHKHRLRNNGAVPLVIIEVQTGEYFGEDDIVRYQDDYDRV